MVKEDAIKKIIDMMVTFEISSQEILDEMIKRLKQARLQKAKLN